MLSLFKSAAQFIGIAGIFVTALSASGIEYDYTGQNFTNVNSLYTTGDSVSGDIVFSGALTANSAPQDLTALIQAWEINDGVQTFSSTLGSFLSVAFFGTDANSDIDEWQLVVCDTSADCQSQSVQNEVVTYNLFPPTFATLVTDAGVDGALFGQNGNAPGTWSQAGAQPTVPEPSTPLLVLLSGCFFVYVVRGPRKV